MPLCAEPTDTLPYSLTTDAAKPEAERPVFVFQHLTERESRKVRRLINSAYEIRSTDEDKAAALLGEAIAVGLVDVRRVKFRGQPVTVKQEPQDYLKTGELWELAWATLTAPMPTTEEKKSSESELPCGTESSAPTVVAPSA